MRPVIEEMVRTKSISPDEALHHPDRNALRSALTGEHITLIDHAELPVSLRKGNIVLIASDGITTLPETVIRGLLGSRQFRNAASIAGRLVATCMEAGGTHQDNTTVAVFIIK
jgi:serine/threonine protein phosphatase PrpC